uniref:Uncharacterized protein n=1 Tax=Sphaerodactylus townsendi TaxID=933632 RepID=A0ACB8FCV3_9SAUR
MPHKMSSEEKDISHGMFLFFMAGASVWEMPELVSKALIPSVSQNGTGTMSRRQNTIQELLQNCSDCLMRAELIVQPELKYGDGIQISRNRELEECFGQADEQMEILDGLIREMRQMGQPCELYQKRYYYCTHSVSIDLLEV